MIMDGFFRRLKKLLNLLFGKREKDEIYIEVAEETVTLDCNASKLCVSDFPVSTVEEVEVILEAHKNPLTVRHFMLEGKHLQSIPMQIFTFSSLQQVVLAGNQLTDIPWSIIYLKQLKILDISFNSLNVLPRILMHLPSLKVLLARNNNITFLPTELLNISRQLEVLDVHENPLDSPPMDIVLQGLSSIWDYLHKRRQRRNLFADFKPWFSDKHNAPILEVSQLFDLCVKCILDCQIDYLSVQHVPPRLKSSLEESRKEERSSMFICKCDVCRRYFSNNFYFEVHDCGRPSRRFLNRIIKLFE